MGNSRCQCSDEEIFKVMAGCLEVELPYEYRGAEDGRDIRQKRKSWTSEPFL
jgi:hypothetical protein